MKDLQLDSVQLLSHIIKKMIEFGYTVNYTKIQKLMYCCYGVVLATHGVRLCKEHPKGWEYGPAFPRAYNAHRKNRYNLDDDPITGSDFPPEIRNSIDETIQHFGKYKAGTLVEWSHQTGSPWDISTAGGRLLYSDINDDLIAYYFRKQVISS